MRYSYTYAETRDVLQRNCWRGAQTFIKPDSEKHFVAKQFLSAHTHTHITGAAVLR